LLCENINIIKNNAEIHVQVSKEIGLEVNVDKIKYIRASRTSETETNTATLWQNRLE